MVNTQSPYATLRLLMLAMCMSIFALGLHAQGTYAEFGAGLNFNGGDIFADFSGGACIQPINASIKLSLQPRLGTRRVLQESGTPNLLYQYQERRFLMGIQADKRFKLTELSENAHLGLYLGALGGVSFADYIGTKSVAGASLAYQGMAGVYLSNPDLIILRLGYLYAPLPTESISPHRIGLSISMVLSNDF